MAKITITDYNKICEYQHKLVSAFAKYRDIKIVTATVAHQGRPFRDTQIYWSAELGVWFFCRVYEKLEHELFKNWPTTPSKTTITSKKIFWNAFGTANPENNKSVGITVEINISLDDSRRVAGLFFKDEEDEIWVGHNGKIHHKYRSRFWDRFQGRSAKVHDENGKNGINVYPIGKVERPELAADIARFAKEVEELKSTAVICQGVNFRELEKNQSKS